MSKREDRYEERLVGSLAFLETDPIQPAPDLLPAMENSIRKSVGKIATLKQEILIQPADGIRVGTRRDVLRRTRMMPLRDIARPLIKWAPGAAAALRVPRADASASVVAAAALRMADALQPHSALLRSAGVTKDFLRQMRQEARGLALVARERRSSSSNRGRARRALKAEISKGLHTLRVIRGLIAIHAPARLGEWEAVSGVKLPVGRPPRPRRRRQMSSEPSPGRGPEG